MRGRTREVHRRINRDIRTNFRVNITEVMVIEEVGIENIISKKE